MIELSVVVKALNEEAKIEACLKSVLDEVNTLPFDCEVLLADSLSNDGTVDRASRYPIRVVQMLEASHRGCGAGVQLGYQHARGRYVLFLDADMQLQPGFVAAALEALAADGELAGVAGLLLDKAVRNAFDAHRVNAGVSNVAKAERWLNGGGLYRRAAIEDAGGYAANRNLKGWEEADLGMRLRAAGWRLRRIPVPAVLHDGHKQTTLQLVRSLWRSGRAFSSGVLLRHAFARPWFVDALRLLAHPLGTLMWWVVGLMALLAVGVTGSSWPLWTWLAASLLGLLGLVGLKRGVKPALLSVSMWHFLALGLLVGLLSKGDDPLAPIPSLELTQAHEP